VTLGPAVQDEAANDGDDSPADGIEGDHAGQHECEDHEGRAAFPVAVSPCVHDCADADENRSGEDDSAGLGEPKPVTEPCPVGADSRHG
jgi:hypothetical protein